MFKMYISVSNHTKNKLMNTKTYFYLYQIVTKFSHIKQENNTNTTQSPDTTIHDNRNIHDITQKIYKYPAGKYPDENKNSYKFE